MEKIQPGKYVEITYDLYRVNPDGNEELVHQVGNENPEGLIIGITQGIVAPLEKDLIGKEKGSKFDIVAQPDEAFGMRSDEYLITLEKEVFEVDGKFDSDMVKPGEVLPMMTADGFQVVGTVLEVDDKTVKMDFNHPLAGCVVRFKGEVVLVRDATEDEIHPKGCGCGCHGNCDEQAGDGNCGCADHSCGCKS